jgi:hypothetical protein
MDSLKREGEDIPNKKRQLEKEKDRLVDSNRSNR